METIKERSWHKEDKPNLIGIKTVDKSIFRYGTQIPLKFVPFFEEANKKTLPARGEKVGIILVIDGVEYNANLHNINRTNVSSDTFQIRYDGNSKLKKLLSRVFSHSFMAYVGNSDQDNDDILNDEEILPVAETMEFYATDTPMKYNIILRPAKVDNQDVNIWWVNQGSTIQAARKEGIIWAPQRDKRGSTLYHWENLREVKPGDIILHYANGALQFVSQVTQPFIEMEQPESFGGEWRGKQGYLVRTEYYPLAPVIKLQTFNQQLLKVQPEQGPLDVRGVAKQAYLLRLNIQGLRVIQESQPSTDWPDFAKDKLLEQQKTVPPNEKGQIDMSFSIDLAMEKLLANIINQGYVFEPWQIAAYVTALRTKPFVILAGISGTGKSRLPQVVAQLTGSHIKVIPVRPDWTDSSELLGYNDLQGNFRQGNFLSFATMASSKSEQQFFCLIDEMNIARVEYYFAEVLSCIENRKKMQSLLTQASTPSMAPWEKQAIPNNFAIIGTVNMDESTHGFSRKVLDRAFTIEFSNVDLSIWQSEKEPLLEVERWPQTAWKPRAIRLPELVDISEEEKLLIDEVIAELIEINKLLLPAQIQIGYRTRDELALFVLHAQDVLSAFRTSNDEAVNVLDIGLQMKILPRIVGSGSVIRQLLLNLMGWSCHKKILSEDEAETIYDLWLKAGRPLFLSGATYPGMSARLCLMWERLLNEGYTSFWL